MALAFTAPTFSRVGSSLALIVLAVMLIVASGDFVLSHEIWVVMGWVLLILCALFGLTTA